MESLGFIGAGKLAQPLIRNLLAGAYPLFLYNRTPAKLDPFRGEAAGVCNSLAELVTRTRILISLLSDDQALDTVCRAPGESKTIWLPGPCIYP